VDLPAAVTLTPPQVTATAISSSVVQLAWNSITGAQGYRIYWWNGFRAVYLGSVGAATTSVRIGNLPAGTINQFLVEAYNGSAFADSDWVSATSTSSARKTNAASSLGRLA
jgi:hypothetical protein